MLLFLDEEKWTGEKSVTSCPEHLMASVCFFMSCSGCCVDACSSTAGRKPNRNGPSFLLSMYYSKAVLRKGNEGELYFIGYEREELRFLSFSVAYWSKIVYSGLTPPYLGFVSPSSYTRGSFRKLYSIAFSVMLHSSLNMEKSPSSGRTEIKGAVEEMRRHTTFFPNKKALIVFTQWNFRIAMDSDCSMYFILLSEMKCTFLVFILFKFHQYMLGYWKQIACFLVPKYLNKRNYLWPSCEHCMLYFHGVSLREELKVNQIYSDQKIELQVLLILW